MDNGSSRRNLYVVGGRQRSLRHLSESDEWYSYDRALIVQVDAMDGTVETIVSYETPPSMRPEEDPAILFKSGTLVDNQLYVPTQTEVLIYSVPAFDMVRHISLPRFNDLHHVVPTAHGTLIVANTGLDMVVELALDGTVLREWNTLGEATWERFSRDVDYRKVKTTKPHHSHPNQVFFLGDELWATRFEQKDAISLTRPGRRIEIGLERVHDGVVHGEHIYFTTVDGKIAVVDAATLKLLDVIVLGTFHEEDTVLGWTRGLLVENGGFWVGFTRIRPTRFRENVGWVLRGFKHVFPTHVAYYDLSSRTCTAFVDLEPAGMNVVFSVHAQPVDIG